MTCPKCYEGTYADGFDDARQKSCDILTKYIHSPFKIDEETLYKIRKELEKI